MNAHVHDRLAPTQAAPWDKLPAHLVSLIPGEWAVWRPFVLRGTGFPVKCLDEFSDGYCASAADRLLAAQDREETCRQTAVTALDNLLHTISRGRDHSKGDRLRRVLRIERCVRKGKLSEIGPVGSECDSIVEVYRHAAEEAVRLQSEFEAAFLQSIERQNRALKAAASVPAFQEAVVWQNRQAFQTGIKHFLESSMESDTRNNSDRKHEQLIANYLQRYCAKNDTIGFFGPVAWGEMNADQSVLELIPGPSLIRRRHTYFETWTICALAEALSQSPEIKWWIPPRLAPYLRVQAGILCSAHPTGESLDQLEQAILTLCTGYNLPADILTSIQQNSSFRNVGKSELHNLLERLAQLGIITWQFLIPIEANSELNLRSQLLKIKEPSTRQTALAALDRLESGRDEVAAAAGELEHLNGALQNMDCTFEELTRMSAHRKPGACYAARTLLYEDCQRDLTIRAGVGLLRPVLPALGLLLTSLRWFVHAAANAFQGILTDGYRELIAVHNSREIPAASLAMKCAAAISKSAAVVDVEQLFRSKWAQLLPITSGASEIRFDSGELKGPVERAFPEPEAGRLPEPVRYYCPDLMIDAMDVDTIRRGEALYVLSELHVAKNTLTSTAFVQQYPCPQELIEATEWDCLPQCFKIIGSTKRERLTTRTSEGVFCPADYLLAANSETVAPSGVTAQPISELLVTEEDGQLLIVRRDGRCSFHVLEAFADLFFSFLMHKAGWIHSAYYVPRIVIDRLVIQRETWRVAPDLLDFAEEQRESLRFLGVRKWKESLGLPQTLFVKTPLEAKPFYLDLTSSIYVEIFCKMIRRLRASAAQTMELSEMLPRTAGSWLCDAKGARYTSEIRFALVDLRARRNSIELQ